MRLRKLNRLVHRYLGYFFFGMTIIYAISGIAINHLDDWNPNFSVTTKELNTNYKNGTKLTKEDIFKILENNSISTKTYKSHYYPKPHIVKAFLKNGTLQLNIDNGYGQIETLRRRPIIKEFTFLHYNPVRLWTYFSDFYAVGLFFLAVTGLFVLKGKHGITGITAIILTTLGIIIPALFLLLYY